MAKKRTTTANNIPNLETINNPDYTDGVLTIPENKNSAAQLNSLVGAINLIRLNVGDSDVRLLLTNALRASGYLIDDD